MKTYKSRINWFLALFLFASLVVPLVFCIYEQKWVVGIILLISLAFVIHLFATTYYQVDEENLYVKSGFFYNLKIPLTSIKKVVPSYSPLASPALSLKRLEVSYGKFDSILVSPRDEVSFIEQLLKGNPAIINDN